MLLLSPVLLVLICWSLTAAIAGLALAMPDTFDLLPVFLHREALDISAFTGLGALWLLTGFAAFTVGSNAACLALKRPAEFRTGLRAGRAAEITFLVNLVLLAVTALWIAMSAQKAGGVIALAALTMADTLTARDLLLETKLFTGMRLFYAALPATGCMAAALLTRPMSRRGRRYCIAVLVMNTVALALLPLVMSQRLLLLQFLLSAYLVTCMAHRRIVGLPWLLLATALFLAVWIGRESLTNPLFNRSAVDLGAQKMAFYFVNDLWNAFAPIGADAPHTLGAVSLRGLMFFTFSDGFFDRLLHDRLIALEAVRGGGEFPLLTAPYVDFGPLGGAAFLALAGFGCRLLFHLGRMRLMWAAIYAQVGAGLLFSSHGLYLTHQNQLFSILVVTMIAWLAREAAAPRVTAPGLWRPVVVFRSRRHPAANSGMRHA